MRPPHEPSGSGADVADRLALEVEGFHPPRQRRSRETLERLTDAAEQLLRESVPSEVSVRELVARAETSIGAFYSRFDDRESALRYASHAFWERSRAAWSAYLAVDRWKHEPAARIVAIVVRTFGRIMIRDASRIRAFVRVSLSAPGDALPRRVVEHDRFIASTFAFLLVRRNVEIRHPSPRDAAEEGFRRILAAIRDHVVYAAGTRRDPAADRALILSTCQMYGRYLDIHPVPRSYHELLGLVQGRIGRPPLNPHQMGNPPATLRPPQLDAAESSGDRIAL